MHDSALILIDLQEDFLALPRLEPHRETIVAGAARLIGVFRKGCRHIIHIRTSINSDGSDAMPHWRNQRVLSCVRGSPGYRAPAALEPSGDEPIFNKVFFSGFSIAGFEQYLRERGIQSLILGGLYLQTCLRQTALDAYQKGFNACIAKDASGSHDPLHGALTLDYLGARAIPSLSTDEIIESGLSIAPQVGFESKTIADHQISKVRSAQRAWSERSISERIEKLAALAPALASEKEALARLIVEEVRKPIALSRLEVERSIRLIRAVCSRAENFPLIKSEAEGQLRYIPRGIVGMITPCNNPLSIPIGKLVPAMVYGNGILWKPSPLVSGIALILKQLFDIVGIPAGLVEIIEGDERTGRSLINSGIDAVSFTGSPGAGWSVIAQASSRMLPLQVELGGNNAAIICPSTDLQAAAAAVAEGAFGFAGQRCTANRRVVVSSEIHDDFVCHLQQSTSILPSGDPWREATLLPPMVSASAANVTTLLVERARCAGFQVIQPHPHQHVAGIFDDSFHPATIILCDDPDSFIVQEESFGPILVVQKARNFDDALRLLNHVAHGLVAALFSQDLHEQEMFLKRAQAGILKMNASTVNAGVDLPFTGWKQSGFGLSEHGEANAEFFTKRQAIYSR